MQNRSKKTVHRRSQKAGLPPGSLVHIGVQRVEKTKISVIAYDETQFTEQSLDDIEACVPFREGPAVTWVNIDGIHQTDILEKIGACHNLHPLVMEDILNTEQRPKIENYDDYLYIVMKMLRAAGPAVAVSTEQISLVLGRHYVISFQEGIEGDVFGHVRERLRSEQGKARRLGADYLVYPLIDAVVDNYFLVLERLGEQIEALEEKLVTNPTSETLRAIHYLKREMIFLRKSVWPLREVISSLQRGDSPLIQDATHLYLSDVYDHTIQVIDTIETYRDMVSGMLDIYLSSVSNRLNAVMKVLTIIATIFMPLTFIAGVYGMNFKYMPELEWRYGYFLTWSVMIFIGVFMLIYFRKKKWL
ncbi:MAG TPA: magnesium/cobalt transporter CorA [Thermodesulfovibrionales bacterium]|nr:magnesium/cobalt transporter CorA [Thermodesulfovibrionales bacterium]